MNLRKDHSHNVLFYPPHIILIPPVIIKEQNPARRCCNLAAALAVYLSLATTNALARGSLKDAANCVTHLELQISEKDKDSERILRVGLAQLTWLAVIAICSQSNSEVCLVISCCRQCWRRRDRRSQRAKKFEHKL